MNGYFKKIILFVSVFFVMFGYFRSTPAHAIIPLAIEGGTVSAEALAELIGGSVGACGYESVADYKQDLKEYVYQKGLEASIWTSLYIAKATDSLGNDKEYLAIKNADLNSLQQLLNSIRNTPATVSQSTSQSTSNTNTGTKEPYMLNDFYMVPHFVNFVNDYVYKSPFIVKYGDTVYYQMQNSAGTVVSGSLTPIVDTYYRFVESYANGYGVAIQRSTDGVSWLNSKWLITSTNGSYVNVGYYTTSKTVYVPSNNVLTGNGIDGNVSDKLGSGVLAVPISAQYSADGKATYTPIEGAVAGIYSGLVSTGIDAGTNTGTDTGVITGAIDGVKTFVGSLIDVVKQILDWLSGFVGNLIDALRKLLHEIFDILLAPLNVILDSTLAIPKFFTIDWDLVKAHINFIDIVKAHLQPIFDIYNLISNVSGNISDSGGKFYMVIPKAMGGDGAEHCVLDLTVGAVYISTARNVIKYGMWMGFVWYVLRRFDPKFSI